MTFKEKLQEEHPECVDETFVGGCCSCPSEYGYESDKGFCNNISETTCKECWNREMEVNHG